MFHIYKYPNGISLNGIEYLLDDEEEVMLFTSINKAITFISDALKECGELNTDVDLTTDQMENDFGLCVEEDRAGIMNCWHCKTELIWGGDHDIDHEDDAYSMVTNLSCPK